MRSGLVDIGAQEDILSDGRGGETRQGEGQDLALEQRRALAGELRGDEHEQLVDHALAEEGGGEPWTALEEERLDAFRGERGQLVREGAGAELEVRVFRERAAAEGEPARLASGVHVAGVEARCIGMHRSHPDCDGVGGGAELVDSPSAFRLGDPALARDRQPAVECHGRLVRHERSFLRDPGAPGLVLRTGLEEIGVFDLDAGRAELGQPAARLRVRVERAGDDAGDPGVEDGLRAWRRRPPAAARLEGDVERGAAGALAGGLDREHLGVRLTLTLVPALADDLAVIDHDGADDGVGACRPPPSLCEIEGAPEVLVHASSSASCRYASAMSSRPKTLVPATKRPAPASRTARMFSAPMPPSTWKTRAPARRSVSIWSPRREKSAAYSDGSTSTVRIQSRQGIAKILGTKPPADARGTVPRACPDGACSLQQKCAEASLRPSGRDERRRIRMCGAGVAA